jgi:hypothetical protein
VLVDVNESIKGPEVPMLVKVVWCRTGLQTSTTPALTRHVFSTTVQPAGSALAVNELIQLLRPSGLVMPVSLAKSQRVLAPEVCTSMVCESSVPDGCGGVPDIVPETFHDGPTLAFPKQLPLPEHILVNGATPGDVNDASIETGSADAPDAQKSAPAASIAAARDLVFIFPTFDKIDYSTDYEHKACQK